MSNPQNQDRAWVMPLIASLTLGLAPFLPEPHLVGKIRWVLGGAEGMGSTDWFDLAMHGAPWLWLAYTGGKALLSRRATDTTTPS